MADADARLRSARRWGSSAATAHREAADTTQWSPEVTNAQDPWEMSYFMRVDLLLSEVYGRRVWCEFASHGHRLKVPKAEQAAFKNKFEISQGNWTLEWCHPSPMPFHTYEEVALRSLLCACAMATLTRARSCRSSKRWIEIQRPELSVFAAHFVRHSGSVAPATASARSATR